VGGCGAVLLLLGAAMWYGWRFGFTPLPEPVPGGVWRLPRPTDLSEMTASNYWYWAREVSRASEVNRRNHLIQGWTLFAWAQTGELAVTNHAALARFLGSDAVLAECYRGALAAGGTDAASCDIRPSGRDLAAHARLVHYAAWRAVESEHAGRTGAALAHLLDGFHLCARSGAPGWTRSELGLLAGAWRRLALEGPDLDPSEGRRLIDELAGVREAVPLVGTVFARAVQSQFDLSSRAVAAPLRPQVATVRRFGEALLVMAGETLQVLARVTNRILGGRPETPIAKALGMRHLAGPCADLLERAQERAGRPADRAQVREAYVSQVLAALSQGAETDAQERASALQNAFAARSFVGRLFDRPAAWRSLAECPALQPFLEEARAARATVESCRLVLALRLYRDRHGGWPERLEALIPEWLPEIPQDPHTGKPFAYQREGNGWLVLAVHPEARAPEPANEGLLFHSAEPAEARLLRLITGQSTPITGVMDVQLLQRYGLLPKGLSGFLSQIRTNQPLAQALSAVIPAVSDVRELIRLHEARRAPR